MAVPSQGVPSSPSEQLKLQEIEHVLERMQKQQQDDLYRLVKNNQVKEDRLMMAVVVLLAIVCTLLLVGLVRPSRHNLPNYDENSGRIIL